VNGRIPVQKSSQHGSDVLLTNAVTSIPDQGKQTSDVTQASSYSMKDYLEVDGRQRACVGCDQSATCADREPSHSYEESQPAINEFPYYFHPYQYTDISKLESFSQQNQNRNPFDNRFLEATWEDQSDEVQR